MKLQDCWPTLIDTPRGFSAGASLTRYTKQWSLNQSWSEVDEAAGGRREYAVRWQHERGGVGLKHSVVYQLDATGTTDVDVRGIELRLFCDLVLACVPDRGLDEVLESLVRINEFYLAPQLPSQPQLQEPGRTRTARLIRRAERPAFAPVEE